MEDNCALERKTVEELPCHSAPYDLSVSDILQWIPASTFVFRINSEGDASFSYVSDKLAELTGLEPVCVMQDASLFLERVAREDVEVLFASAQQSSVNGSSWQQQLRIYHPTKGMLWIDWLANPVGHSSDNIWKGIMLDITEQKLAEQKAELFESITNHSSEAVYLINEDCRFEYINDAVCHMLGYAREELLGMGPNDIDPAASHSDVAAFQQRVREQKTASFKSTHRRRDGSVFPVEVIGVPVERGSSQVTLAITRDISQQKRIMENLLRSEREFLSLAENLPDNIGRWDAQGRFLYINPALERTMQVTAADILGRKVEDVVGDQFSGIAKVLRQVLATAKPAFMQRVESPTPDGGMEFHDVKIIPEFDDSGYLTSVLCLGRDMTEHYQIMDQLTAYSNELSLLRCAVDASTDAFFIIDENFHIIDVNDNACQTLGYKRSELLGMTPLDIDPDLTLDDMKKMRRDMEPSQFYLSEVRHQARNGRIYPVELGTKIFHQDGARYAVVIARDISERKRAEREKNWLEVAVNVSADALYIIHVEEDRHWFASVNDTACRMLGYSREELMALTIPELDPNKPPEKLSDTVREMEPDEVRVVETVHRCKDGHLIPVEVAFNITDDEDGQRYMIAMARDITQRANAEQAFRSLAENSPDFIISYDPEHRIRYLNDKLREELKLDSSAEVIGLRPIDIWPDGRFNMIEDAIDRVIESGVGENFEFEQPEEDGSVSHRQLLLEPEYDAAGQLIGVLAFGRIITSLRENERRLRHLLENLPGVASEFYLGTDGKCSFPFLSQGIEALYGVSHEEAIRDGTVLFDRIHPDDRERIDRALAESAKNLIPYHEEYRIIPANAPERWLEVRSIPERQPDGGTLLTGIKLDISERKRAQHRQYLLERALERMFDGSILVDRKGRILEVNRALCEMLNYSKAELLEHSVSEIIDELANSCWAEHWEKITRAGGNLQIETHCLTRTGDTIPAEVAFSVFEFEGESYNLTSVRNIAERKQIEDRLQMAASVFGAASEGIIITDPTGKILDTNPAFSQITGYSCAEVIGKNPSILSSGMQDDRFYQDMWSGNLVKTGFWSGEIINKRKNGDLYVEQLNIAAVHDSSGTLKHYVGIFTDISRIKQQEEHLQHIAHHDVLTSLPNRLLLTRRLAQAITQARRSSQVLAILYLDLDGFKPINDNFGHETGDLVLIKVAQRLTDYLRSTDTVARIGGDEFVILLTGVSGSEECRFTASRLLDIVSDPIILDDQVINLSVSIGVCVHKGNDQIDPDTLLRKADQAMYLAKNAGRNQFVFHNSNEHNHDQKYDQTIHDLRLAIQEEQFSVYYQPIIDLETGLAIKAEALLRWLHPTLGMIPPSEFIPVAENGGLINTIGDLVFHKTVQLVQQVNTLPCVDSSAPIQISVNRSPRQFFHRDGASKWIRYLIQQNIDGRLLGIEITEGLLLDDWSDVHRQLNQLRSAGLSISLDDFGTGYSALSYLKKFSIDYLKIDRSFVNDIVHDPDSQAIVRSIIAMARQLGIKTIGEGVETPEQAEILKAAGCDYAQGYYYARPMPDHEFSEFIIRNRSENQ